MPQDATCPQCKRSFPVIESRTAFTVTCPACDAEMTVEFKKPAAPHEAGKPHYELLVTPGALADQAAPPPKPKRARDEDDDNEPKSTGGSAMIVMLSGGFGMMIVLGGLGLTAWVLFGLIDTTPVTYNRATNPPNNQPNNSRPNIQPNVPNLPNQPTQPVVPPKPKDTFDLRPVTGAVPPIQAPTLPSDPASVTLGRVGQVAVGGGGRYLVMHLPDKGQLTVFDANTAQFTATVPADTGDAYLTAGLSKVVLAAPNSRIFRVYSLPNLSKEYDSSGTDGIRGMAMGSRTNGPMVTISTFGRVRLWSVGGEGITEVEEASAEPGVHWHDRCLRAAPDGTAFSTHDGFRTGQNTILLTTQNRKWKVSADTYAVPFPGADGNFYGNGIAVNKNYQDVRAGGVGAGSGTWFLPSVSSKDFFVKLVPQNTIVGARRKPSLTLTVHKGRNSDALAAGTTALVDLPEFENMVDRFRPELAIVPDQHIFLIPEAKLLVTLTQKRDTLYVRRVEPR